jgi:hypothetical protein
VHVSRDPQTLQDNRRPIPQQHVGRGAPRHRCRSGNRRYSTQHGHGAVHQLARSQQVRGVHQDSESLKVALITRPFVEIYVFEKRVPMKRLHSTLSAFRVTAAFSSVWPCTWVQLARKAPESDPPYLCCSRTLRCCKRQLACLELCKRARLQDHVGDMHSRTHFACVKKSSFVGTTVTALCACSPAR